MKQSFSISCFSLRWGRECYIENRLLDHGLTSQRSIPNQRVIAAVIRLFGKRKIGEVQGIEDILRL